MRIKRFVFFILLVPAATGAQPIDENWILPVELSRILRAEVPQVRLGGGVGGLDFEKLGSGILGRKRTIYNVEGSEGFAPDLIKTAIDKWFDVRFSQVSGSSAGSRETGFILHDWVYHHAESGIVGSLTICFPDTSANIMKMVVVVDERKSR